MLTTKKFGSITVNNCNFALYDLLDPEIMPKETNLFYELYLSDSDGNLIDVPVLNKNIRVQDNNDGSKTKPNQGDILSDDWLLTRRFFIYDTISGIVTPGGYNQGTAVPEYIRWADKINIKVEMDLS